MKPNVPKSVNFDSFVQSTHELVYHVSLNNDLIVDDELQLGWITRT